MTVLIIGILIGLLLVGAGIYYFVHDKADKEMQKISAVFCALGAVVIIVCAVVLFLNHIF